MAMHSLNKQAPKGDRLRFDIATLRNVAGEKVFARGVAYNKDGQVEIVSINRMRILARVIGSEIYRSELTGTGKKFSGQCSCPAFSDWGFCKHLVAVALAVNDLGPGAVEQTAHRFSQIRSFLRAKGIEPLVDIIMDLAERDRALLTDLELAAAEATADDQTLFVQFQKAITQATHIGGFIEYREVREWAKTVERVLDRIANLVETGRPELALRLLDYFFTRMDAALNRMDDSDGHGGDVYEKACEIHLAAAHAAHPEPIHLAQDLFSREVNSDWGFFHRASERYAKMLGKAGLAEYRRLAGEAWQAIKPLRAGSRQAPDDQFGARYRLRAILESFATRDGDVDARIAIRASDLSTAYDYLEIAQLCLDHGREADALKWTEDGLWQFEDRPDQRLVSFAVDLYRRMKCAQEANELLWRIFERLPSIELYRKLKAYAGSSEAVDTVQARAIALLQVKLDKSNTRMRQLVPRELLLQILVSEKRFAEAWDVMHRHGCSDLQLLVLAKASEQRYPDKALSVYAQEVERLASLGGRDNYEEATKLIGRMRSIRERLKQDDDHHAFVAAFMTRHKAKRNLMKLMQDQCSS